MRKTFTSGVGGDVPPAGWKAQSLHYLDLARQVFVEGDTVTIRIILAVASLAYAAGLLLPLDTFSRPAFSGMRSLMPQWLWALCLILHFVGVIWRIADPVPRPGWAFFINAFGIAIWALYVGLVTLAVGEYTPSTAMEITVLLAALVALVRTGLNDERFSP